MLSIYIDGQDFTAEIDGVKSLKERIYLAAELRAFIYEIQGTLIATGGAYNYLRNLFQTSICSRAEIRLIGGDTDISGDIILNDIKWNLTRRAAEVQIVADPFISLIDNNKGIEVTLGAGQSKNLTDISAVAVPTNVTLTKVEVTAADAGGRQGWRIEDAFRYIVAFVSDNQIGFVSDFFDYSATADPAAYAVLMTGREVLYGNTPPSGVERLQPTLTFNQLWTDCNKLFNLGMSIDRSGGQVRLRIEPMAYWYSSGQVHLIDGVRELKSECNREMFYSTVRMGSKDFIKEPVYLGAINFYGFKNEQFFLQGDCNIENELSLLTEKIIIDTNAICSSLPASAGGADNDEFDEEVMLIEMISTFAAATTPQPFLPNDYYYNNSFRNINTSERWAGWIPFTLTQVVESLQPLVRAAHVGTQIVSTNTPWQTFAPTNDSTPPNFDIGGDYQVGNIDLAFASTPTLPSQYYTGYFTAPVSDYYQFNVFCQVNSSAWNKALVIHARWNGTFWVQESPEVQIHNSTQPPWGPPPNYNPSQGVYIPFVGNVDGSAGFFMEAGDIVMIYFDYAGGSPYPIFYNGVFEVIQYGGVYAPQPTDTAMIERLNWEMPIDDQKWNDIKTRPYDIIQPTYVDGFFISRLIDINRTIIDQSTSFTTAMRRADNM